VLFFNYHINDFLQSLADVTFMTAPRVTALILVGGKGSRMDHQDKGWISYKNKPLIQHAIDIATPQVQDTACACNHSFF